VLTRGFFATRKDGERARRCAQFNHWEKTIRLAESWTPGWRIVTGQVERGALSDILSSPHLS